jgi:hypothetical protein
MICDQTTELGDETDYLEVSLQSARGLCKGKAK